MSWQPLTPRQRLIVALDVADAAAALGLVERLREHAGAFKVGLELFAAAGPEFVRRLVDEGTSVFLDLKFHDIPNTVRAATRQAAKLGAFMLDVHASGGGAMMQAAVEGASEGAAARPLILGVTILTSLAAGEMGEIGITGAPEAAVERLARLTKAAGLDGVVASPREARIIRAACGPEFLIVTPGIRPARAARGDQARAATPAEAIEAGADLLVVGRPITRSSDPAAAAGAVLAEIAQAQSQRPVVASR